MDYKPKDSHWIPRSMRKRVGKGGRAPKSQTEGSAKGKTCQLNKQLFSGYMARRNRSYKHKLYAVWSNQHRG